MLQWLVAEHVATDDIKDGNHREARPENTDERQLYNGPQIVVAIAVEESGGQVVSKVLVDDEKAGEPSQAIQCWNPVVALSLVRLLCVFSPDEAGRNDCDNGTSN